jgi:nitrogen regulatory protein PII
MTLIGRHYLARGRAWVFLVGSGADPPAGGPKVERMRHQLRLLSKHRPASGRIGWLAPTRLERISDMKMVVAYIDPDRFEPIREELLELGFLSLSLLSASGTVPEPTVTATYRGAVLERHQRPKARIECVVGDNHASTVVDTVLRSGGERTFAFVVPVDEARPTETVKTDDVVVETG